jgi:glycosyltransferase involved in cell wall biosynthesis
VPDRAGRGRPTTGQLRRHRAVTPAMRALLRLRRRPPARAAPKVTILLVHAWGMGGTIRTMLNVAGMLAERHEVEVVSLWRRSEEPFFAFPPGVTVSVADDRRPGAAGRAARLIGRVPGALLFPGDRTARRTTLWTDLQLVRRLWSSRSDVLIGTRPALNLLVAQVGGARALVATEHTDPQVYTPLLRRELRGRYGALDAVVVLCEDARGPLERALGGSAPVYVIPNAVSVQRPGSSSLDPPVVLAAGRLVPAKAFGRLIRAFALVAPEHPDWRLRICGDGPKRRPLRALVAELGLERQVELAGRVRDMEAEFEGASIFALSSRVEGLPLALLEAMAKGLPVVSFDRPAGPRSVIAHGVDGLLVPGLDVAAFSRALGSLMDDEALRRRLGEAAVRKAAAYGREAVGARWKALVARVTQG